MTTANRCVYLCADGLDPGIRSFRQLHDPLGNLIEPHVTLVFPFVSEIGDDELLAHVSVCVSSEACVAASLDSRPVSDKGYIYFPVRAGADRIRTMHDRLYTGILRPFLLAIPYVPHITVARGEGDQTAQLLQRSAALEFRDRFRISTLKVVRILADGTGELIDQIMLKSDM